MKINLNNKDIKLLKRQGIIYTTDAEYTEDQAFALLDSVHDVEICFAQNNSLYEADVYAKLADKIQSQI